MALADSSSCNKLAVAKIAGDCRQKSDRRRCFCHSERSEAESKNLTLRLVLSSPKNQGCFGFAQHDGVVGLGRLTGE